MKKRVFSLFLALALCLGLLPVPALAADPADNPEISDWLEPTLSNPKVGWGKDGNYDISWYVSAPTGETSFVLEDAADLAGLAVIVNGTYQVTGDEVWNEAEATMGGSYKPDDKLQDDFQDKIVTLAPGVTFDLGGKLWIPIGYTDYFRGTFDGNSQNGTRITNMTIQSNSGSVGLFGQAIFAHIKNVAVENAGITAKLSRHDAAGGIVGRLTGTASYTGTGSVDNCSFRGTIDIQSSDIDTYASGIIGVNSFDGTNAVYSGFTVENCVSYAAITGGAAYTGGIVGWNGGNQAENKDNTAQNCRNYGEIKLSSGTYLGGIAGSTQGTVKDCQNYGALSSTGLTTIGGVAGWMSYCTISNCINVGSITQTHIAQSSGSTGSSTGGGDGSINVDVDGGSGDFIRTVIAGGIVGIAEAYGREERLVIENCHNRGAITSSCISTNGSGNTGAYVGGVLCQARGSGDGDYSISIYQCSNTGSLSATGNRWSSAGGLVEDASAKCTFSQCYNAGTVTASTQKESDLTSGVHSYAGGLAANSDGASFTNCYNVGAVTARSHAASEVYAGGLAGLLSGGTLENCYNAGTVTGTTSGGIAGSVGGGPILTNCIYWDKCVTAPTNTSGTSKTANQMTEDHLWSGNDYMGLSPDIWAKQYNDLSDGTNLIGYLPVLKDNRQSPDPYLIRTVKADSSGSLIITPQAASVSVGGTVSLTASGASGSIIWFSRDESVATVSGSGASATVTGVGPGTVEIIAAIPGDDSTNDVYATAAITVNETISHVDIGGLTAPVQGETPVSAVTLPADVGYTAGSVTWSGGRTDQFEYGKTYAATVTLTAEQCHLFADNVTITLTGTPNGTYPTPTAVKNGDGTLTVTVEFQPVAHKHNWDTADWKYNEIYHWNNCVNEGCNITKDSEKPGYDRHMDDGTGKCLVCGAEIGYTVTLNLNYEGASEPTELHTNVRGQLENPLPVPTRENYSFEGWFTDPDNGTEVTGTEFTQSTTLYAHWSDSTIPYVVIQGLQAPVQGETVPLNKNISVPEDVNYTSLGSASWTKGGESLIYGNPQFQFGEVYAAQFKLTAQEGFTFTDDVQVILEGVAADTYDDTEHGAGLTAKRSDDQKTLTVTVTFDPVAHEHSLSTSWSNTGTQHYHLCLRKEGCPAEKKNSQGLGMVDLADHVDSNGDGICEICKKQIGYQVRFEGNGGRFPGYDFYKYLYTGMDGRLKALPDEPTLTGWLFDGWYTQMEGGEELDINTVYTSHNNIFYAHWRQDPITEVTVYGLTAPAQGERPDNSISVPGTGNYTGSYVTWKDSNGDNVYEFQSGESYTASISLSGNSGYYFGDSASEGDVTDQVTVNLDGLASSAYDTVTVTQYKSSSSKYSITIKVTFKAVDHTHEYNPDIWNGSDALTHWHVCTAANCPNGGKISPQPHIGEPGKSCSVCGHQIGYRIEFERNDNIISTDFAYTDTNGRLAKLPTYTYRGIGNQDAYRFLGWFTAAEGGEEVTTGTVFTGNTTIYIHWEKIARYDITLDYDTSMGSISASPERAEAEESVTLTITPSSGYELASLSVTWTGGKISYTPVSGTSGQYTFQMPAGAVTVEAVFAPMGSPFAIQNKPTGTIDTSTQPFTLTASGGTGSGPVMWQTSNEDVATVVSTGGSTAQVTIKGPGTVTITAWRVDGSGDSDSCWFRVVGETITQVTITGLTSPEEGVSPDITASVPGEDSSLYYVVDGVVTWKDLQGSSVTTFQKGESYTAAVELKALNGAAFANLSSFPVTLDGVTEGTYTDISAQRLDSGTLQVVVTFGPVGHQHDWDRQNYKYDELTHWMTCKDPDCTVTTTPEKHTGSAGGACLVCGGPIGYQITLNCRDEDGNTLTYYTNTDGQVANLPATLQREGYVFAGWFTQPEGGSQVTADTVFHSGDTIYARWAREAEYTITVEVDSTQGTVTPSVTSAPAGTEVTLNVSPAQGWVFQSLTVSKAGGGTVNVMNNQFTMPADHVTVTAVFVPESTVLTISGLPEDPIYQGDQFRLTASSGPVTWSSSDTGVATVSASGYVTVVGAGYVEITAQWGTQTAKAAFTAHGPDIDQVVLQNLTAPVVGASPSQRVTVPEGMPYEVLTSANIGGGTPTLDVRWEDAQGNPVTTFELNQAYTVTVVLKANDSYAFSDGEISLSLESIQESALSGVRTEKQSDGTLAVIVTFKATDHLHSWDAGWSYSALYHWHDCLNKNCPLLPPGMDGYVHHDDGNGDGFCDTCGTVIGYLITFDSDGGSCDIASTRTDTTGRLTSLPTPVRNGYAFTGWYTADWQRVTTSTVFSGNTVIRAGWSSLLTEEPAVTYPVETEDTAHGSVVASPREAYPGNTVTLTAYPDAGYVLDRLTVTDARGGQVPLTPLGGNKFTFQMPGRSVTVSVSFVPAGLAGVLPFTDVPADAWYYGGVCYVYENGLMAGTSATTFSPNVTTSRAMIATILWRLSGSPVVDDPMNFTDVPGGLWYSDAVRWAASQGVVAGYEDGTFRPDDPITREQLAVMLYRVAQGKGLGFTGAWAFPLDYVDADQVSDYAYEAMCWVTMHGVISGMDGSLLSPQGQATRAQAAVMLMQFTELLP